MGIFDLLKGKNMNDGVAEFEREKENGAVLLDVRTVDEYRKGHVPGSMNIPLQELGRVQSRVKDKDVPLYVHCLSGGRSAQAAEALRAMGYTRVFNIGGIQSYKGKIVR